MEKPGKGVYVLVMQLTRPASLTIGRLGKFDFQTGFYLYVGSALSGFAGRINRHLKKNKKLRWHVDYLLEAADLLWIDLFETESSKAECTLSGKVAALPGAKVPCPGFGASDCSCRTHLYYFRNMPAMKVGI